MRKVLIFLTLVASQWASGQACTTHIMVNVFDERGRVIDDLRPEYFAAKTGKVPLSIASIEPMKNNRMLVLVDASGGAEEARVAESVKTIADVTRQAPEDRGVAFGIFGERVFLPHGFASDPKTLNSQIDEVMDHLSSPALGKYPALFDALHEALSLFGEPEPGDTILLVSRGLNYGSRRSAKDLSKELSSTAVRLLVLTGDNLNHSAESPTSEWPVSEKSHSTFAAGPGEVRLLKLAQQTGGSLVGFIGPRWFTVAAVGYAMTLESPASFNTAKNWSLEFTRAGRSAVGRVRLVRPEMLPPCPISAH